jgi:putative membrane protein
MQFLKILLWVVVAVFVTVLAGRNWHDVTVNLWGDIQADIKLPVLLVLIFLAGFLPPYVILRARRWQQRRREEALKRQQAIESSSLDDQAELEPRG